MDTLAEILERLSRPIDRSLFQVKKKGGSKIDYVAWYDLADLLDTHAPGWEYKVQPQCYPHHWIKEKNGKQLEQHGLMIVCKASITIHGSDGSLTREAIGYQDPEEAYIGDEATNAEATALRRTCAKLGLGRDMWRKDKGNRPQRNTQTKPTKKEQQLTPEQMQELLRTHLESKWAIGTQALSTAIDAAKKRIPQFPEEQQPKVKEMIQYYAAKLEEMLIAN